MKNLFNCLILLFVCTIASAQLIPPAAQPSSNQTKARLVYSYDAAGNRVKRELIIVNYMPAKSAPSNDSIFNFTKEELERKEVSNSQLQLEVYPNPTQSNVIIEIKKVDENYHGNYVFDLIDISGKVIQRQSSKGENIIFNLEMLAVAEYFLIERNSFKQYKIIKK